MSKVLDFLIRHDWLGHIVEAAVMAAIVGLLFWDLRLGLLFAVGHFHGREKRDYEVSVKMKPPHLRAYWIGLWSKDQLTDFLPVAALALLVLMFWR